MSDLLITDGLRQGLLDRQAVLQEALEEANNNRLSATTWDDRIPWSQEMVALTHRLDEVQLWIESLPPEEDERVYVVLCRENRSDPDLDDWRLFSDLDKANHFAENVARNYATREVREIQRNRINRYGPGAWI